MFCGSWDAATNHAWLVWWSGVRVTDNLTKRAKALGFSLRVFLGSGQNFHLKSDIIPLIRSCPMDNRDTRVRLHRQLLLLLCLRRGKKSIAEKIEAWLWNELTEEQFHNVGSQLNNSSLEGVNYPKRLWKWRRRRRITSCVMDTISRVICGVCRQINAITRVESTDNKSSSYSQTEPTEWIQEGERWRMRTGLYQLIWL